MGTPSPPEASPPPETLHEGLPTLSEGLSGLPGGLVRGRFAPSPTGGLHLGSALAALAAWLSVRSRGGQFVYRIEDLDGPRVVPGAAEAQVADLRWLGLDWDEGPDALSGQDRGPHAPYRQSARGDVYEAALARLARGGHLFPCTRSRKDLLALASAPHGRLAGPAGAEGLPPYPAAWRPQGLRPDWYEALSPRPDCALRFRVDGGPVAFEDRVFGRVEEDVRETTGDFVLKRRDGAYAYQLAVVADDLQMGITEVVRGADLLDSTARQTLLIRAIEGAVPAYAHVPLLVGPDGEKLSKRHGGLTLRSLREAGVGPPALVGWLAWMLGQQAEPAPVSPSLLTAGFLWSRVPSAPAVVPDGLAEALARGVSEGPPDLRS